MTQHQEKSEWYFDDFYQKNFKIAWCVLSVARLEDEAGNTKVVKIEYLRQLVFQNLHIKKKTTAGAVVQ